MTGVPDSAFERAVETAKPAIDYCLERGYTLLYTANGPEPAVCVRLAVRDVNMLRAEAEESRAVLAGRCLADITLRDEEHRQAVCILAKGHDTVHDDGMGTTWTDKDHWKPLSRAALEQAWDEGLDAGRDRWMDVREFGDAPSNPYRKEAP